MVNRRGNKISSITALMGNKNRATRRRKSTMHIHGSKKLHSEWNGALTPSFLEDATKAILLINNEKEIPVIYARKGIIYKKSRSVKIQLGKITGLKRQIKENNYTIEYIKISE